MTHIRFALAALSLAIYALVPHGAVRAQDGRDGEIAIIGSSVITKGEVERIAAGRPNAYAGILPEERREKIRDTLLAEYLIDYYYGSDEARLSVPVRDGLDDARRQVLFQFFAQSQFRAPEITEEDVARFVSENPGLFSGRRSYRHAEITIAGGSAEARKAALARVEAVFGGTPSAADLDALVAGLQGTGLATGLATSWVTSEVLPQGLRARLEAMVETGRPVDIARDGDRVSVLRLFESAPVPADPARLRGRIEQRLTGEAFAAHREALIRDLAQKVLAPPDDADAAASAPSEAAREVAVPPRGSVVWSGRPALARDIRLAALFGLAFFGAVSVFSLLGWLGLVLRQAPVSVRFDPIVPMLKRRVPAAIISVSVLGALVAGCVPAIVVAERTLGGRETLVLTAVAVLTALAVAVLWFVSQRRAFRRMVDTRKDDYTDPSKAHDHALLDYGSAKYLLVALAAAGLYGACMAMVFDYPAGLG